MKSAKLLLKLLFIFISVFVFFGCSSVIKDKNKYQLPKKRGVKLSSIRKEPPPSYIVKEVKLNKDVFKEKAADIIALGQIRLVEIYRIGEFFNLPKYRIFGIRKGSAYDMLKLEDGDIIVAANDWVIFNPAKFPIFVHLLRNEKEGTIEIIRNNRPILYKYIIE